MFYILVRTLVFRDITGRTLTFSEGVQLVLDTINQPLFYPYTPGLGDGLLGGKVVYHYEQGSKAGEMAVDILENTEVKDIPLIKESPNKYVVDHKVMEAYNLKENRLPEETEIINKEISFFEQYFMYIITIAMIVIFQAIVIFVLIWNMNNRKRVQKKLLETMKELKIRDKEIRNYTYVDSLTGLNSRFAMSEIIENVVNGNATFGETSIMKLINTIMHSFRDIVVVEENSFFLTFSVGVSLFPLHGMSEIELIKKADMALYQAKNSGKNTYVFYEESMDVHFKDKVHFHNAIRKGMGCTVIT